MAIEANLRCIDQTGFFETFFRPFLQTDWVMSEQGARTWVGLGVWGCTVHCTRWLLDTWLRKTKLLIKSMESPCLCIWKSNLLLCHLLTYNQKLLPFSVRCQALYVNSAHNSHDLHIIIRMSNKINQSLRIVILNWKFPGGHLNPDTWCQF